MPDFKRFPHALQVSGVSFEESPLGPDPSPRLLDNKQMVLSDFTQEDFTFPANLSATLQVKPNLMPQTIILIS